MLFLITTLLLSLLLKYIKYKLKRISMQTNNKQYDLTFFLKMSSCYTKDRRLYQIHVSDITRDLHMPLNRYRCKCINPYNFQVLLNQVNTKNKKKIEQKLNTKWYVLCQTICKNNSSSKGLKNELAFPLQTSHN